MYFGLTRREDQDLQPGIPSLLCNEGRRDFYSSDMKVSKWRMRWVEHVARMGNRYACTVYCTSIQKMG